MIIDTTRFGPVRIESDDLLRFPEGVLGLPGCRDWVLLADLQNEALAWLQSVDSPEIALGVVNPRRFVPSYQMRVARRELEPLQLEGLEEVEVLVVLGRAGPSITLNLKAPLVLNLQRRVGRQVVTNGDQPLQYVVASAEQEVRRTA